jgi:hypothetical protein
MITIGILILWLVTGIFVYGALKGVFFLVVPASMYGWGQEVAVLFLAAFTPVGLFMLVVFFVSNPKNIGRVELCFRSKQP